MKKHLIFWFLGGVVVGWILTKTLFNYQPWQWVISQA